MIYYGDVSCEADMDRYLESLKSLWRRRPKSRETPFIINTMGWVKGRLCSPNRWVEMAENLSEGKPVRLLCLQGLDSSCWWT